MQELPGLLMQRIEIYPFILPMHSLRNIYFLFAYTSGLLIHFEFDLLTFSLPQVDRMLSFLPYLFLIYWLKCKHVSKLQKRHLHFIARRRTDRKMNELNTLDLVILDCQVDILCQA